MHCRECGAELVACSVPPDLREYAPEESDAVTICSHCLRVQAVEAEFAEPEQAFDTIADYFPPNEAGVAMALGLGLLDALALHRTAVETLFARVEQEGADPLLTLDRLAADESVEPHFDIDSRRVQLEEFLA